MTITKQKAQKVLHQLDAILSDNEHYILISRAYASYMQMAADSLERRPCR